jgi:hypothetical protein
VVCGPMGQRTDRAHIVSWDLGVGAPGSSGRRLSSVCLLVASSCRRPSSRISSLAHLSSGGHGAP